MKMNDNLDPCFIIAEAGSNWKCGSYEEDLDQAKKLIRIASSAGADAIKFQTYKSKTVYVENAGKSSYLSKNGIDENINDLFDHLSMPYKMIPEIAEFCKEEKIAFMSTPFSVEDASEIDPFVKIHKIASFEINHVKLLEFLAKTGKPIILSTGASDYEDIKFAIKCLKDNGCNDLTLLQCTSEYPCMLESLNLKTIPEMRIKFNVPVGFSDHSKDPVIGPVSAVALGATIVEKHFTLNKNLDGPDHKFAINPEELELMVRSIRDIEKTFGEKEKKIIDAEKELRQFATRSIQAIKDIKKGEKLIAGHNFEILRPGNKKRGLPGRYFSEVNNRYATMDIMKGDGIIEFS
jgi:N-acetylneuraminate synthase